MATAKERNPTSKEILNLLTLTQEAIENYERSVQASSLEPIEKLGEVIRVERKKQKIPRDILAKLSGVSVGTITAIEAGKTAASLSNVQKILQALGRTLWIK